MSEQTILVTGGTGTLGAPLVRALRARGHRVIANYAHDELRARRLRDECGCEIACADVSEEIQVQELFAALPPLFAVVHSVGLTRDGLLLRQTVEQWNQSLRVNTTSAFMVARRSVLHIQQGGRLIFVASRIGEQGAVGQGAYAAHKAAVLGIMRCLARETAGQLAVNAVCPPFVPSSLSINMKEKELAAKAMQSLSGKFGNPEPFVGAIRWLLSDCAGDISGQVIHCDDRI